MMEPGAAPAGRGMNAPSKPPGGAGPRPEALGPPARSSLTGGASRSPESADRCRKENRRK